MNIHLDEGESPTNDATTVPLNITKIDDGSDTNKEISQSVTSNSNEKKKSSFLNEPEKMDLKTKFKNLKKFSEGA